MPLARIITHSVEVANSLIKQLKARGYTVETRLPGESSDKPADLEIVLEKVNPEEALSRATSLAKTRDSNVYIGAGTFRAHRVDAPAPQRRHAPGSLPVPSVEDTVNGVAAGLQNKRDLLAKAIWEQRANMREARRLQRERVRHEQARVAADAERLCAEEAERTPVEAAAEAERQRIAAAAAERQTIAAAEAERQRMVEIVAREQAERIEKERAERMERERAEEVERIAAQQAEAERQAQWADQQHAIQAFSSVEHDHAELPVEQKQLAEIAPAAHQDVVRAADFLHRQRARSTPPKLGSARSTHSRAREWRAAVIVSSIFALLLMLAWRTVTRGPVSPWPTAVTNQPNLQQEVPFGGVTLSPPGSDVSENLAPAAHPGGNVLRPIPADLHSSTRPSSPLEVSSGSAGHRVAGQPSKSSARQGSGKKRSTGRPSRPRRITEDEIAEDEVIIRHFTPKPAATPPSAQKASLKRYSDLDE